MADRETSNRDDPGLGKILPNGQREAYLVLTKEQRDQGFTRPYRESYRHLRCGSVTTMSRGIAETYARSPGFYSGTFCCVCGTHYPVGPLAQAFQSATWLETGGVVQDDTPGIPRGEFVWVETDGSDGPPVGT